MIPNARFLLFATLHNRNVILQYLELHAYYACHSVHCTTSSSAWPTVTVFHEDSIKITMVEVVHLHSSCNVPDGQVESVC